jgi:autotransporter passenger strand-loop-strand repeat protein
VVDSGGQQEVGGTASGAVLSGGTQVILFGSARGTVVSAGGSQLVLFGAATVTTIDAGGSALVNGGATMSGAVVNGGTLTVEAGAMATDTVVSAGGSAVVLGTLDGAALVGIYTGTAVISAVDIVSGGGVASGTQIGAWGVEAVSSGGTASAAVIGDLGTEVVSAGGTASGAIVSSGGTQVLSGGTAVGTMVNVSAYQTVFSGGVASDTTVGAGGFDVISAGGSAVSATILSGGAENVDTGGLAVATVVDSGGQQEVAGTASGAVLDGGTQVILGGTAVATTVNAGGSELVIANGAAATTINSGGSATIFGGATASGAVVSAGGLLTIESGATVTDTTLLSGGTLDLAFLTYASGGSATINAQDVLTVSEGATSTPLQLAGSYSGEHFVVAPDTFTGTLVSLEAGPAPCFAAGTTIMTAAGPLPVERLAVGDRVVTATGTTQPIRWLGTRDVDCRRHRKPLDVWPVRIRPGAFGDGLPSRDLFLSPDHAVFLDGVLIPVRYLINGATIVQERRPRITYWHVELERHDVILAEGLACESYLDTGNRGAFINGGTAVHLHPDFALSVWEAAGCARLVRDGAELVAARRHLFDHAAALGHRRTRDPDLHLVAGAQTIRPEISGRRRRFLLPTTVPVVRLASRAAIPAQATEDGKDTRRLGVAVSGVWLDGRQIALTDGRLSSGWYPVESAGDWRWTDGNAGLALAGVRVLEIEVALTERYWLEPPTASRRKAAPVARVWTAPPIQGVVEEKSDLVRERSCVRPVWCGTTAAGPDGFRDPRPNG